MDGHTKSVRAENTIRWREKKVVWHILFSPGVEDQAQRKNDANLMLNDGNDYENGLFCRTQSNTMVWTFINGRVFGTCRFRFRYQCVQLGYLCFLLSIYYTLYL